MTREFVEWGSACEIQKDPADLSYCEWERCPDPDTENAAAYYLDATCAPITMGQGYFHDACYKEHEWHVADSRCT